MLQQIGRGEHSEQCLPTLILVLGKKETLLGISLQRVTGQTESEFFRGSRVVPMGLRRKRVALWRFPQDRTNRISPFFQPK